MPRVEDFQAESALRMWWEQVHSTGARNTSMVCDEIEIFIAQTDISRLRIEVASHLEAVRRAYEQIEYSQTQMAQLRAMITEKVDALRELEDKAGLDNA